MGVEQRGQGEGEGGGPAARGLGSSPAKLRTSATEATSESTITSAYMRASCASSVMNGFVAVSTAATQPARSPNSIRAPHHATGMAISASSSDSARAACSL